MSVDNLSFEWAASQSEIETAFSIGSASFPADEAATRDSLASVLSGRSSATVAHSFPLQLPPK